MHCCGRCAGVTTQSLLQQLLCHRDPHACARFPPTPYLHNPSMPAASAVSPPPFPIHHNPAPKTCHPPHPPGLLRPLLRMRPHCHCLFHHPSQSTTNLLQKQHSTHLDCRDRCCARYSIAAICPSHGARLHLVEIVLTSGNACGVQQMRQTDFDSRIWCCSYPCAQSTAQADRPSPAQYITTVVLSRLRRAEG
jgi:hypothetical protein